MALSHPNREPVLAIKDALLRTSKSIEAHLNGRLCTGRAVVGDFCNMITTSNQFGSLALKHVQLHFSDKVGWCIH